MILFRKYYKDANNDIKPDEAFINNVIKNAEKQLPPVKHNYIKYGTSLAAAVLIVSAAVISMPVWQKTTEKDDFTENGVIITDTALSAAEIPNEENKENGVIDEINDTDNINEEKEIPQTKNDNKTNEEYSKDNKKSNYSNNTIYNNTEKTEKSDETTKNEEEQDNSDESNNNMELKQEVQDTEEYTAAPSRTPPPDVNSKVELFGGSSSSSSASDEFTDDVDLPVPNGYKCVAASWNGYKFVSDDGAEITVAVKYGETEESEPYYSVDGENIWASFSSYGMKITVNATGADMSTVEEIINSLRQ
jgi:hypothetical protein